MQTMTRHAGSPITEDDLHLFNEGTHYRLYYKLGAHLGDWQGQRGAWMAVWAPNARLVSVTGEFNHWSRGTHRLHPRGGSGIWEGFIPGIEKGTGYRFHI